MRNVVSSEAETMTEGSTGEVAKSLTSFSKCEKPEGERNETNMDD
jgi:hypothetical protein